MSPLFVPSLDQLKAALRLTGTASHDALAIIDRAVRLARIGFYDRLGTSRVSELLNTAYEESPTSEAGILRLKAAEAEVSWVRMILLREMPVLLMPAQPQVQEIWNQEGLTRSADHFSLEREIGRLQTEIENALADLSAGMAKAKDSTVSGGAMEPDTTPPRPFDSIRPPWMKTT